MAPKPPVLPVQFTEHQFQTLRALAILCKGAESWKALVSDDIVPHKDLHRMVSEQGRLDFRSEDRPRLGALYQAVFAYIDADERIPREAVRPLLKIVYGSVTRTGWGQVEDDIHDPSPQSYAQLAGRLVGTYLTYRRGTSTRAAGEIVTSPLEILPKKVGDRTRIDFRIVYPSRVDSETGVITGRVVSRAQHLHFMGYDQTSSSPYLMSTNLVTGDEPIRKLLGVAMRTTTQSTTFAARVFAERFDGDWDQASKYAALHTEAKFRETNPDLATRMNEFVDNTVAGGGGDFVLRQYVKKAEAD